ncbi:MAG: guanylate kinase [Alphaproteobacteria bacterium]|jgi:guanylate kinase|nr:guanylate kinase [Alphaproteobacteria bacterium]
MKNIHRRGIMLVLSSPSGAGKTTIATRLLDLEPELTPSISVTTRPSRPGEVDGRDYVFVTSHEFHEKVEKDELLEHAEVFGYSYGTPKRQVLDALNGGKDIIFDIDWQGTQQLAQLARSDLVSVFILPPSTKELERRLRARAQDNDEVVNRRMADAANEMSHWAEYDYVIINHDLEQSVAQVRSILIAERLRRTRLPGVVDFVNGLRHSS